MSLNRKLLSALAPLSLLALGACATPFRADVARFQQLPQPAGQSFFVQAGDPDLQGGLEFQNYAALVSQRLTQQGYRPSDSRSSADLVVSLDYGVDTGREKIVSRPAPFFGGWGGGWGGGGWGRGGFGGGGFGGGRFGGGWGRSWAYGWNDPFWGGGWGWGGGFGGSQIDSYTFYTSFLDMRISRSADGQRLFEGHAKARSASDRLTELVPNLVDAMFTEFPGRSGEEIRITIPPPNRDGSTPPPRVTAPPRSRG